jgi:DNA polymerase (family 10)
VLPLCENLEKALADSASTVVIAGSVRRWKETVGDIDVLAISSEPEKTIETFAHLSLVEQILSEGSTKSTVLLKGGIQSDLRVLPEESFGSALQYFTGSKAHNIRLRKIALKKGFKLNEYGLFNRKTDSQVAGRSEKEIYHAIGLAYIPPELREDQGEIEAAQTDSLPDLIEKSQIRGDFHVHTRWSDGSDSIESLAQYARRCNYEYIGIADHSKSSRIANGLTEDELSDQNNRIQDLNDQITGITVLSGIECDILPDGSLDYPDSILEQLDFVIAAVHSRFKSSQREMTARVIAAMRNPLVNILAHPTGRIIGRRDPAKLDLQRIFRIAAETDTALEINCYPDRLDLNDIHVREAKEYGAVLALGTDAHSVRDLDFMELGVRTARRGWAEPKTILNTLPVDAVFT